MAEKKKKHPGGRPSKFDKVNWELAQLLFEKGMTDSQVAEVIDVTLTTLQNWKLAHPEFFESLKNWKKKADEKVEKSLYERARGYICYEDKVFYDSKKGEVVVKRVLKHYPPDPTSMIFWLKNRKPDKWRDKTEHVFEDIDQILIKRRKKKD